MKFEWAKTVIETGLAERDKAHIGLKWPLAKAEVKSSLKKSETEILDIIAKQLNVKNIEVKLGATKVKKLGMIAEVKLDTKSTPELEAEGYAREMSRQVQAFRKKLRLEKKDKIQTFIITDDKFRKILEKEREFIKTRTNSKKLEIVTTEKERFKNKMDFRIKDKRGNVAIIITDG